MSDAMGTWTRSRSVGCWVGVVFFLLQNEFHRDPAGLVLPV